MKIEITESDSEGIKVVIPKSKDMLTMEDNIEEAINQIKLLARQRALSQQNTDKDSDKE
jgi:hypothetical protein